MKNQFGIFLKEANTNKHIKPYNDKMKVDVVLVVKARTRYSQSRCFCIAVLVTARLRAPTDGDASLQAASSAVICACRDKYGTTATVKTAKIHFF